MTAFIGSGRVKVAPYGSGTQFGDRAFVDVGNTSAFAFSFTENRQELRDFRDPAGGVDASVARIESVTGSMDLRHFTAANLALALWGTTAALAATPITNEAHKARLGRFVALNRIVNTAVAVVVRVGATVVNTADYVVSAGGGVAANVGMIGEEFGTLQVTFTVEKDATVPGVGKSQFFELQQAV